MATRATVSTMRIRIFVTIRKKILFLQGLQLHPSTQMGKPGTSWISGPLSQHSLPHQSQGLWPSSQEYQSKLEEVWARKKKQSDPYEEVAMQKTHTVAETNLCFNQFSPI